MKYASIASERTHDPIGFMCRVLDVSTSGFFAGQARRRAPRRDLDAPLREAIVRVHQESRGARAAGVSPTPCGPRAGASTSSASGA